MNVNDAVKVGQVWADNDKRAKGRTLRVLEVTRTHAVCEIVTNADDIQEHIDSPTLTWFKPQDRRGKQSRVALDRMRPTSTGYVLVQQP